MLPRDTQQVSAIGFYAEAILSVCLSVCHILIYMRTAEPNPVGFYQRGCSQSTTHCVRYKGLISIQNAWLRFTATNVVAVHFLQFKRRLCYEVKQEPK